MPPEAWTILKLLNWTTDYFKSHHIEQPRAAAEILLAHTLAVRRLDLYIQYDRPLEPKELEIFRKLIQRRLQREPVAYIVGTQGFWSLDLKVSRGVLIPRPETETLVEAALAIIPKESSPRHLKVLDLGTGSGAVVLALATERAGHYYYATDCSKKALAVARNNALTHGLDDAITFMQGQWFDAVRHRAHYFDLVLSNPPYISHPAFQTLPPEVSQYEPREALDGGPDGLEAIRVIIEKAADYMASGGSLLFEIGYDQREAVEGLIVASGFYTDLTIIKDASGLDRVVQVKARKRPNS
jgi:release factor glutamine methyltransferase